MVASLPLEPVPACPVCGTDGPVELADCHDFVYGLEGRWAFRRCAQCSSRWLDPRPARAALPLLHPPAYYTHRAPGVPLQPPEGLTMQSVFSLKLGVVAGAFGYQDIVDQAPQLALAQLGRRLARLSVLADWAGHYVRFIPRRAGGRLLDVGSGNGTYLALMRALGWSVEGIEPDAGAGALARRAGLAIRSGTVEDLRLDAAIYDAITLHHVLEHFGNPGEVLRKLATGLRPGGLLVSISPNPQSVLSRWFGRDWRGLEPPRHPVLPTRAGYDSLLARAGLEPVRLWTSIRTTSWMLYESLVTRRTGHTEPYRVRPVPEALSALVHVLAFASGAGEEVICLARRPSRAAA